MKIVLTGGGTGGHFYPLIAVAQELRHIAKEEKLLQPELYFLSDAPYDPRALFELGITFKQVSAGKVRRYFSILNFFDVFRTAWGCLKALITVFNIYPDIVFAKGGYASFPTLMAARILGIPVVIHESDSKPGKVSAWAGKFAKKIALSYPDAAQFFPEGNTAWTGNPIRPEIAFPAKEGASEFLGLEDRTPVIFVLGGSQGSQIINDTVIGCLDSLIEHYQIIHQTGKKNYKEVKNTAEVVIGLKPNKSRYKPFDYLNLLAMRMSAGVADLVISRSGSTLFEIAAWGVPSIIIPIPETVSHDQVKNAYNYARSGAASVIEENNLTSEVLLSEIRRILDSDTVRRGMAEKAKAFSKTDAATLIAKAIVDIGLTHEK
jgi:UDP-N-acetylglucosamine--N-acetylmuramyl-(pentapeptide) pyrophosphoryl-undecaprenol N-acetylglucosamine transferase